MKYDFLIVGAGFSGAIIAERIASQMNKKVLLVEKRGHIAGNAYDEYDEHGILVHRYGPHIFHTNSEKVINYLSQFTEWMPYEHKVLARLNGELYPIPINRSTLNKLYKLNLTTDREAKEYLEKTKEKRNPILNSEDIIVNQVGYDLFEKFFRNFTKKQWSMEPKELSPSVCGRIPVRTNDDCRYFTDRYQYMPKDGYTSMFKKILSHKNIEVVLNTDYKSLLDSVKFNKLIYTGPIDYYFDYKFGKLAYRSIRFEFKNISREYFQETAQVNYVDDSVAYTRVVEHKYLSQQKSETSTISFEYPQHEGEPFYPVPSDENRTKYLMYKEESDKIKSVYFCGRLAEYQYYNMDQVTANTLNLFSRISNG